MKTNIISGEVSLNRTMQYGNKEMEEHEEKYNNTFKSYYVVWKLLFKF